MRTSVHDDVPLPPLTLADVIEHRDAGGSLYDPPETDAIGDRAKRAILRKPAHQAAHRERGILRTVIAIDRGGVVTRRQILIPRRRPGIVFSAAAWRFFVL